MKQDLDTLLAYAMQHPDTFTIHPYLIDACIEYPNLNKATFKIDLYAGRMLPLNYAQLAVLEARNRHDPELYTTVYVNQLRRGGVTNDHPTQDRRYDRIQRSREDQLINRLIFESTPVGLRKSLFRRK